MPDWIQLIKSDVARFNAERKAARARNEHPDLTGADLRGLDLAKADIGRCNLTRANLAGTNAPPDLLATCRLEGANLADLRTSDKSSLEHLLLIRMLWDDVAAFNRARPDLVNMV